MERDWKSQTNHHVTLANLTGKKVTSVNIDANNIFVHNYTINGLRIFDNYPPDYYRFEHLGQLGVQAVFTGPQFQLNTVLQLYHSEFTVF